MEISRYSEIGRLASVIKPRRIAYFSGLLGCCLIDSSTSLVIPLMLKFVLDAITEKNMSAVGWICFEFAGIIAVLCMLMPIVQYRFGKAVKTIMTDLRLRLFHHMERLPVAYYENTHSGDSVSRVNQDIGVVENAFAGTIRSFLSLILTGGYSAAIMFLLDWRFAAVMILMGFGSTYINSRFARPLRRIGTEIQENAAKQLELLSDSVAGTQVSRVYQMSDWLIRKYNETNRCLTGLTIARAGRNAVLNSINYMLMWIKNSGAFIVGSIMLINGQMTLGTLLSLVLLLEQVTNLFRQLGNLWANIQSSLAGAVRVFEFLDVEEEPESGRFAGNGIVSETADGAIEFRGGSFGYHDGGTIIDGLSFKVNKGQVAALVGPSGGGKSTILKLLLGYYPLGQGEILIEGKRLSDYSLRELRDRMAYVSQDAFLFEGTIEENIRYGRMDASFDDIVSAARTAHAHDFIMELSDGFGTMVGERGARLSGGQKQRIAIARALLKNAQILLLDEATSALDSVSEQAVQQGLERLMAGRTTIAIAHRLSTIKQADQIYVIDKGKIVERGTHDDLLKVDGVYSRLHHIQERNRGYRHLVR